MGEEVSVWASMYIIYIHIYSSYHDRRIGYILRHDQVNVHILCTWSPAWPNLQARHPCKCMVVKISAYTVMSIGCILVYRPVRDIFIKSPRGAFEILDLF